MVSSIEGNGGGQGWNGRKALSCLSYRGVLADFPRNILHQFQRAFQGQKTKFEDINGKLANNKDLTRQNSNLNANISFSWLVDFV